MEELIYKGSLHSTLDAVLDRQILKYDIEANLDVFLKQEGRPHHFKGIALQYVKQKAHRELENWIMETLTMEALIADIDRYFYLMD